MFAHRGDTVAHFKCTVLLLASGTSKVGAKILLPSALCMYRVHVSGAVYGKLRMREAREYVYTNDEMKLFDAHHGLFESNDLGLCMTDLCRIYIFELTEELLEQRSTPSSDLSVIRFYEILAPWIMRVDFWSLAARALVSASMYLRRSYNCVTVGFRTLVRK